MTPLKQFFVLAWLVVTITDRGQCEISVSEVHQEVLELREVIRQLTSTVAAQNTRITHLQRAFQRQRINCRERVSDGGTRFEETYSVAATDDSNTSKTTKNETSIMNNNHRESQPAERHASVETHQPLTFHSSLIREGRLLVPQPTQHVMPPHVTTAFYAYLSSDLSHTGQGQIIKFDVVKTNAGNGYHPFSGTFIAPETGYYAFSWTSRIKHYGSTGEDHALELVVNRDVYGSIYMKSLTGEDGQATGLAIAHVNKGDDVYIQTHHQDPGSGSIRSDFYGRSSFAGWRLY